MMFRLQIGNRGGIIEWGNAMVDPNWAQKLAQEKQRQRDKKSQERERILSDRQTIKAHSQAVWLEFRQELKKRVDDLNAAMNGEEVLTFAGAANHNRVAILRGNTQQELFVGSFNPDTFIMSDMSGQALYRLVSYGTSQVVWQDAKITNMHATSEEAARIASEDAFKKVE